MHPSPQWVSKRYALPFFFRFAREARNVSALKHPYDWIGRKLEKQADPVDDGIVLLSIAHLIRRMIECVHNKPQSQQ